MFTNFKFNDIDCSENTINELTDRFYYIIKNKDYKTIKTTVYETLEILVKMKHNDSEYEFEKNIDEDVQIINDGLYDELYIFLSRDDISKKYNIDSDYILDELSYDDIYKLLDDKDKKAIMDNCTKYLSETFSFLLNEINKNL